MRTKEFDYKNAAKNLKLVFGDELSEPIKIYTICSHVSKSGMSRDIKAFVIRNNETVSLGFGRVGGCGMDMGFHVAYNIFCTAYDGFREKGKYRYQEFLKHSWV